jgi:hypothetical protein
MHEGNDLSCSKTSTTSLVSHTCRVFSAFSYLQGFQRSNLPVFCNSILHPLHHSIYDMSLAVTFVLRDKSNSFNPLGLVIYCLLRQVAQTTE